MTDSNSPVILPNLDSASAYTVSITTTLNDTYGGLGSPSSYTVYTGYLGVTVIVRNNGHSN